MKLLLTPFMIVLLAESAFAQGQTALGGGTLAGSILQTVAALAVVVGLILLFSYLSSRFLKSGLTAGSSQKYIRVLETRFLAPKKSLLLIEVGGEYLLLASSGDGLQFIKQIDMLEEIEVMDSPGFGRFGTGNIQNKIIDLVARLPRKSVTSEPERAAGGKGV